jgi:hypothetical protein
MADSTEDNQAQAEGPKIKLAANPTPPDEIFIDGVAGILARPGLVKLDCYRVVGIDRSDNAEVRSVTHRLVMPSAAIPEMVKLFQNAAQAGRQASNNASDADAKDQD